MNLKQVLVKSLLMSAVSLFIFGLAGSAVAQTWIELSPVGSPPDPVYVDKSVFFDAANNRLIVFFPGHPPYNGNPPGNGNEVWVLTDANGLGGTPTWIKLLPGGSPPLSNGLEGVVYDQGSNRLTVYGGCWANCSPALSNVFVLTNANGLGGTPVWSQSTVTNPQPRAAHSSVYDSANNLILSFGGHLAFYGTDQNDTRLLSNANGVASPSTWSTLSTTGGPPPIRNEHTAIYDQANNRMTIFGGTNSLCCYSQVDKNDLWVLANANGIGGTPTWSQQTPLGSLPTPRMRHSAVYDSVNNRMLVFGGMNEGSSLTFGDLWQLDNANGLGGTPAWTQLLQLGTPPGPRYYHTAAFDTANQRMILFGGIDSTITPSNRVWILVFNNPPIASCQDVTVSAGPDCTANASIDNGSSDPDSGDTITLTQTPAGPYPLGNTTVTLTVTDSHGASSSCQAIVTVEDTTAPALTCPENLVVTLPPNSTATSMAVSFPAPTATDNCSAPTVVATPASGSVFPVGTTTVNVTATDGAGNQSTCSFTVTVLYNFIGFFHPVDNLPTMNLAKAGSAIPVKWSLAGYKGMDILAAGYPVSGAIPCDSTPDADLIEQTVTAGSSGLNYDAAASQYIYVWKTDKAWAGTCRQLVIKLNDGTYHRANFRFTR